MVFLYYGSVLVYYSLYSQNRKVKKEKKEIERKIEYYYYIIVISNSEKKAAEEKKYIWENRNNNAMLLQWNAEYTNTLVDDDDYDAMVKAKGKEWNDVSLRVYLACLFS